MRDKDTSKIVLDIGCGTNKVPGTIGLDKKAFKGVDVICDFVRGLPFGKNSVDVVYLRHVLEHIHDLVHFMEEVYRICKKDAVVYIDAPYYSSRGAFRDPTHLRFICEDTFQYFDHTAEYYGIKTNFKIEKVRFDYRKPFKYFPGTIRKRFRRYLLNVVDNLHVVLIAVK